jgi:hypothetical protein
VLNADRYSPEILASIHSGLEPDEEGLALSEFVVMPTFQKITVVLTNRHIRFMGFKPNWRGQVTKDSALVLNTAISLHAISAITTAELKTIFGGKEMTLIFYWEGHKEDIVTAASAWFDAGKAFTEKFKEAVAKKEVASSSASMADELQKLTQLNKEGILSEEEYNRAKNQLIGVSSSQVDEATKLLRQLHDLHKQGVLSESEFNMKKWDVLSHRLIPKDKSS